ncbi:MAG TPA: DnaB-like helicase C-terminal domain-containing protein, partial [Candidatus Obscuribacterales bacterium]
GKTSSHASMICGVGGFAWQGAKVAVLCNEESVARVSSRYLTAATGMSMQQIRNDRKKATEQWAQVKQNLMFADGTGKDMHWVEAVTKSYKPDILVLDMGDKFASKGSHSREDQKLKDCAIHARQIAKEYDCAVFYMSQLSASAEGKVVVDQSMMEGSRTGKAAEADLMLLISKNPDIEGLGEEDPQRHITVAKNKVTGWHGRVTCEIDPDTARFTA